MTSRSMVWVHDFKGRSGLTMGPQKWGKQSSESLLKKVWTNGGLFISAVGGFSPCHNFQKS